MRLPPRDKTGEVFLVELRFRAAWQRHGYGCDAYIEATSTPVAVAQGLDMIRKLGTLAEFSVALAAAPARFNDVFRLVFCF
jgi:threonine dehydrogenase-like Zn-dependent dehydrogenase